MMYKPLPEPTAKAFKRARARFKREHGYAAPTLERFYAYLGPDHPEWPNRRFPAILVLHDRRDVLAVYFASGDFVDPMSRLDEPPLQ
jgi:hypothetical protein